MAKEISASVTFTESELWELMNIYGAGYEAGGEGNELADKVSSKLRKAHLHIQDLKRKT